VTQKVLAPRLTPPPSGGSSSNRLPDDVLAEQARRMVLFSGVAAFMWVFGFMMDAVVLPATIGASVPAATFAVEGAAVAVSLGAFLFLRFVHLHTHAKCAAGLWLLLLNGALLTLLELSNPEMIGHAIGHPSWIAILILTAAMIMPSTPRRTLIGSLLVASMGPIAISIAGVLGRPIPPLATILVLYLPNFIWAVVATLPSALFQRMGRELRQARELGSYELVEQLGAGGMGSVWRARHRLLARDAAVKLVRPEAGRNRERGAGAAAPLRTRSSGHGVAAVAAFDPAVRLRRHRRRQLLLRDGAA
jgi:eukaryotic-like serine/threonine-protein kinase